MNKLIFLLVAVCILSCENVILEAPEKDNTQKSDTVKFDPSIDNWDEIYEWEGY